MVQTARTTTSLEDPRTGNKKELSLSEASFLIRTEDFLQGDQDTMTRAYMQTKRWLSERFLLSIRLGVTLPVGFDNSQAQLTIRPCNNGAALRRRMGLVFFYEYISLYFPSTEEETYEEGADRLASEVLETLHFALQGTDPKHRPTHIALSYDDDAEVILFAKDYQAQLYSSYCFTKEA